MPKATPFPLKDYFASLAFLSLLLSACVVVLPQSTSWFYPHALESQLAQRSSADRPEHPWLTPFTSSAAGTAAWCAFGVAVTMLWWGGKVGAWWGVPALNGKVSASASGRRWGGVRSVESRESRRDNWWFIL
jgi:phosphatidylinositol glycan class F